MIKPVALIFAVAVALAPAAATAAYSVPGASAPGRGVHTPVKPPYGHRRTRPIVGQEQRPRASLPAISRNPEDCTRTMCTCLAGGGC
jgi:hypothetical protein